MSRALTKRSSGGALRAIDALGKLHVLAVGVEDYPKDSGFGRLRQCTHDAAVVKTCFTSVFQLHADPARVEQITSGGDVKPTKGNIMTALRALARDAGPGNRVLFYFSGHG